MKNQSSFSKLNLLLNLLKYFQFWKMSLCDKAGIQSIQNITIHSLVHMGFREISKKYGKLYHIYHNTKANPLFLHYSTPHSICNLSISSILRNFIVHQMKFSHNMYENFHHINYNLEILYHYQMIHKENR